jgi:hypothetical protein
MTHVYNNVPTVATDPNFKIVNGLPVHFDSNEKNILLTFSGGADSTLLLYILCQLIRQFSPDTKLYLLTFLRGWEGRPWNEILTKDLLDKFKVMFPDVAMEQVFGFIPSALEMTPLNNLVNIPKKYRVFDEATMAQAGCDIYATMEYTDYVCQKFKIGVTYSGCTTNPEEVPDGKDTFRTPKDLTEKDLWLYNPGYHFPRLRPDTVKKLDPFFLINKDWVMAQYDNFGIADIKPMTRSCAVPIDHLKLPHPDIEIHGNEYACGVCHFCTERQWGEDNKHIYLRENHQ